jgi:hypothetical protein
VELTEKGDHLVTRLTRAHLAELHDLAVALHDLVPDEDIAPPPASAESVGSPAGHAPAQGGRPAAAGDGLDSRRRLRPGRGPDL